MDELFEINRDMFVPSVSILEIILRGTIIYIALFLLMRLVLKRESGTVGVTDLLVVVLIADASQNAMSSDYKSVPEGLVLVSTILFWAYTIDWLGFHVPLIARLVREPPLELVRDGQIQRQNLRKELITVDELEAQLREQGVDNVKDVKRACIEGDGQISVVKFEAEASGGGKRRKAV